MGTAAAGCGGKKLIVRGTCKRTSGSACGSPSTVSRRVSASIPIATRVARASLRNTRIGSIDRSAGMKRALRISRIASATAMRLSTSFFSASRSRTSV